MEILGGAFQEPILTMIPRRDRVGQIRAYTEYLREVFGDVEGALPVLESAVSLLAGSSSLAEAYASYNLAAARFGVGRCDGVAELLDRSEDVQGERKEIDRLRKQVERRCEVD
mgnify:CR=1 FL=1